MSNMVAEVKVSIYRGYTETYGVYNMAQRSPAEFRPNRNLRYDDTETDVGK